MNPSEDIAALAARLIVESGCDYAFAKHKAARQLGLRRASLPSNEEVEDAVREHLDLFCADTQPAELEALRAVALQWMDRLAVFRPHLSGAVWRGTATRLSPVHLDLYADDPKAVPIALLNLGVQHDVEDDPSARREGCVLVVHQVSKALGDTVPVVLHIRDLDELRGALQPDARGRSWRGDRTALLQLLQARDAA